MTDDTVPSSDGTADDHWHQETIDGVMDRVETELAELEREASGRQRTAVRKGRELLDEFESVLREAAAGEPPEETPPYEESDAVDVSEARKRP